MTERFCSEISNLNRTRDARKTLCPLKTFFVTDVLYHWISQFKFRKSEIHFGKLLLKQFEMVLIHLTQRPQSR